MSDDQTDASQRIDERITELGDWRGKTLSRVRSIIKKADPEVVEEWKWEAVQLEPRGKDKAGDRHLRR